MHKALENLLEFSEDLTLQKLRNSFTKDSDIFKKTLKELLNIEGNYRKTLEIEVNLVYGISIFHVTHTFTKNEKRFTYTASVGNIADAIAEFNLVKY